ncbi:MAG: hypothetical protein DKM22_01275 [Candidatus Melainabacteria bacterium]|nr:MAG: hypothetical protein DKM22_01275 [Candidatus Melainabacteria bacterium]
MKILEVKDGKLKFSEVEKPILDTNGAILKIHGCGLCGSDIVKYKHSEGKKVVLGHEIVGEIVEINSDTDFKVGDVIISSHHIPCFSCDYCRNGHYSMCEHFKKTNVSPCGFSEYVFLTEEHLKNVAYKVPNNLTEIEASFYEPLGCCVRAVKRAFDNYENKKVLVIGLGSIGLLMGQALNAYGAKAYGCDILEDRIALADEHGIISCNSSEIQEKTYDAIFMTSGADVTIELALKAVKNGGKIVVFASTPRNFGYANNEIYYRELTVMGSYSPSPKDLKDSLDLLTQEKVRVDNLSTVYNFDDAIKAFEDTINNKILKAYVKMQ